MRFTLPLPLLVAVIALACARSRPAPPPAVTAPGAATRPSAPAAPRVSRGMDAAQVRGALGEPARKEKVGSVAAPGAAYERWIYPDREVILLDGKVVDVL